MSFFRRRRTIEETFELLRFSSAECSGLGLEEEDESEVAQENTAKERPMKTSVAVKEFCCYHRCNMGFGLAERRVATGVGKVMHEDCYEKHLREEEAKKVRIHTTSLTRSIH